MSICFILNGKNVATDSPADTTLLKVLREEMHMYGVKRGCETGECGACTVLVDGENINSCMMLVGEIEGKSITTIEGLTTDGELDPIQRAFAEKGAVQCGFCTPGMIMSVKGLLNRNPNPTRAEIKEALSGNLCRCTGYEQIFEAVESLIEGRKSNNNG
ncbi:(2Fe-2S)-binding protein [Lutispora saccharofermentans]|uniref:(2Fe-2S)-binding protein n=1 Tax=Lutispora saccharofermentans TaxID=3024236 RepID=A0ABT1NDP3_9FIRM|nr:(2Fe-2S)-binding protein [Lutispora saccharofermentans]MCQ1529377.1 (2Fe-2S)-binding protein [Lutispora saccharofermentans]